MGVLGHESGGRRKREQQLSTARKIGRKRGDGSE